MKEMLQIRRRRSLAGSSKKWVLVSGFGPLFEEGHFLRALRKKKIRKKGKIQEDEAQRSYTFCYSFASVLGALRETGTRLYESKRYSGHRRLELNLTEACCWCDSFREICFRCSIFEDEPPNSYQKPSSFIELAPGCINADFSVQIPVFQHFSRPTRSTYLCTAVKSNYFQMVSLKIVITFA